MGMRENRQAAGTSKCRKQFQTTSKTTVIPANAGIQVAESNLLIKIGFPRSREWRARGWSHLDGIANDATELFEAT